MSKVVPYDAPSMPFSLPKGNIYNSPNMQRKTVSEVLDKNQQPLGTQFKSYELNQASNYWTLDPFQYSITKFQYNFPDGRSVNVNPQNSASPSEFKNDPGLVYHGVNFEKLLPSFTQVKKSANDFTAMDYHRFEANEGYFNPKESVNNTDLWYYGACDNARTNGFGIAGVPLNVQELNHIIFPEPQRGGLNTQNLTKYSWSNFKEQRGKEYVESCSWEGQNIKSVNNDQNCQFFNYNSGYNTDRNTLPFNKVYNFNSDYCRNIGISGQYSGSMPFNPKAVN
jgi:hypothetical protein